MKKLILGILAVCFFLIPDMAWGQGGFPGIFRTRELSKYQFIADAYDKNYKALDSLYILANGTQIERDGSFHKTTISEIYYKDGQFRMDLRIPSDNFTQTLVCKNNEYLIFTLNDQRPWFHTKISNASNQFLDPRKFGGLGWFRFDLLQTLALLKNIKVSENQDQKGNKTFLVSGTNLDNSVRFEYTFSSRDLYLCSKVLIDYGETVVVQETDYTDIKELNIKFPKKLTEKYYSSKDDFKSSKDQWYTLAEFDLQIFSDYKISDEFFNQPYPERYLQFDPLRDLLPNLLRK